MTHAAVPAAGFAAIDASRTAPCAPMKLYKRLGVFSYTLQSAMFLSLDYLYVPARDIEASLRYYTGQLGGELVWKIHAFNTWVAAVRLSQTGSLILLAEHLHGDTPILIYRVERLESAVARLRAQGWTPESGPFEIPNGPCYTFRDPTGVRLAIYENQRPEVNREFAGRIDTNH
jgi:catechol 2,3-dioxygenase-like lactoylglutathione lyase family enzyme